MRFGRAARRGTVPSPPRSSSPIVNLGSDAVPVDDHGGAGRLPDPDDRDERVRDFLDGVEIVVERHRVRDPRGVQPGQRRLGRLQQLAPDAVDAGVLREQLIARRHRPRERGQVDPGLAHAVDQLADGLRGPAVRCAERHERPRDLRAAELVEVPARDEAAHRVADEDDLCVRPLGRRRAPAFERLRDAPLEQFRRPAVGEPPVVREEHAVLGGEPEPRRREEALQPAVAVHRRPDAGNPVQTVDEARGHDAVGRRPVADVRRQLQRSDRRAESGQRPHQASRAQTPDLATVRVGQRAPRDPRHHHDEIRRQRALRPIGLNQSGHSYRWRGRRGENVSAPTRGARLARSDR